MKKSLSILLLIGYYTCHAQASAATMRNLGIFIAPYNFILDDTGKIVAKNLNTKEVFEFLQARLN